MDRKKTIRALLKDSVKRLLLGHIWPAMYRKYAAGEMPGKKAVFLEERGRALSDNCKAVRAALRRQGGWTLSEVYLQSDRGKVRQIVQSSRALRELAGASFIFIDDSSELISCLPLRKQTKVVQLWHACGAFKKFGYSLYDKKFGANRQELEQFPWHRNFSVVTVSSPEVVWAYAEAFHMEDRKEDILPVGVARTDIFYREKAFEKARHKLERYVDRTGVRIALYAPTFRGNVSDAKAPGMPDFGLLHEMLGPEWIFLIKQHPFVTDRPPVAAEQASYVFDLTDEMAVDELMMVSDVCISDYSSLVFEFSLLERPILFYAPDLEDYNDWRGFYYSYEEMTPGPVFGNTREMGDYLLHLEERFDAEQIRAFRRRFMSSCDGHATRKLLGALGIQGGQN